MDRVFAVHAGSQGFYSHRRYMSERFFRSNRPGYPQPVCSELENSGIREAVGDCSVTERRRWRPPYQTAKLHMCTQTHYKHDEDGRTAPGVRGHGSIPLSHPGNVVTKMGLPTHIRIQISFHGRTHGAPYYGHGYSPLKFGETSLGELNKLRQTNVLYLLIEGNRSLFPNIKVGRKVCSCVFLFT